MEAGIDSIGLRIPGVYFSLNAFLMLRRKASKDRLYGGGVEFYSLTMAARAEIDLIGTSSFHSCFELSIGR